MHITKTSQEVSSAPQSPRGALNLELSQRRKTYIENISEMATGYLDLYFDRQQRKELMIMFSTLEQARNYQLANPEAGLSFSKEKKMVYLATHTV